MLRPISSLNLFYLATPRLPSFSTSLARHSRSLSFMTHSSTALIPISTIQTLIFSAPHIQAKNKKRQYHNHTGHKKIDYSNMLFILLTLLGSTQLNKLMTQEENDTNKVNKQLPVKSLTQDLSPASLKRVAPFLKDIDSAYMIHYIDNMEALLELAPPTQEESEMLYERVLDSIYVHTQSDEFRSWVQGLFLKLSKSALGKMVLEKWMAQCNCNAPHLRAKVIDERRQILPLPARAIAPNEIGLHYQYEGPYFSSVVSGIWKMPSHIILAHEMLHCIRWNDKVGRNGLRSIEKRLSNAEEEYTILGIEKQLYTQAKEKRFSNRLLDHLCEAAFFLNEGLPPRLAHSSESPTSMTSEDALPDLLQLKRKYYQFIAKYVQYEIDIIPEHSDNREIVIEAVRRNTLLYPYVSSRLQCDHEVILETSKKE